MNSTSAPFLDDRLEKEKSYWLEKLSGDLAETALPLDRKRPPNFNAIRRAVTFCLEDRETESRLRQLCGRNEALTFTVLLTALKICLHRYTGAEDIIVGTSIHERHSEVSSINKVLVLRNQVRADATVKQLLQDVKATLSEAYANQKFPFESLVKLLAVEQARNRTPLLNVVAILDTEFQRENVRHLMNDVTVVFTIKDESITIGVEYNPDLFLTETIELFGYHLKMTLNDVLFNTDAQVSRLDLLTGAKKREMLFDFNETQSDYPQDKNIAQLFAEQAARTPDRIAVADGQQSLTYRELNARANQLAHSLVRHGVRPGILVGIYLEHSVQTIVALLAVLKAGGGYVPLDTHHPKARLSFIFKDAAFPILLTEQRLLDLLPESEAKSICLDADWDEVVSESADNPTPVATPADIAYVIYTSGSTGEPKGVRIRHDSLVNYVWWAAQVYLQGEDLDFPLYSSLAFDLTVTSIYTPLVTGNRVVVYRQQGREPALFDILRDNQVGVLKLTPSHLALIKEHDNSRSRIKRLIVGGEALETALAAQIQKSFGGVEIFNEYGPTEATVGCMIYRYDSETDRRSFVPIGRPAANTQIYLLDDELQPVAENIVGELYISGDGLAVGYLNRDEQTRARFVNHPSIPDRKMYRTGDLARRLPEGIIEYVGRRDEQVKFHGHRVELNEICSALNKHPQVRKSVVVVTKDAGDNDVMVAYYVSRQELEPAELHAFLAERIIEETIPNLFVHLHKLPLTVNGKLDLRALPTLEAAREKFKRVFVAPRNPVEEVLSEAWAQVLRLQRVGIHDNFFELGGHSLLVTKLLSRIRETLKVELTLRTVFESPTIAELSTRVEAARGHSAVVSAPPLVPVHRDTQLPLSFAQQRLWFIDQLVPGSPFYNISTAVRLKGQLDVSALERTLTEITRRHEVTRTTFPTYEGRPVQMISPVQPISLPVTDLSGMPEGEREAELQRLLDEFARRPFDLARGPLLRVALVRLGDEEHGVLFAMHHIISDGWSMGVLTREVTALYEAFSKGKPSPLAELPIQYADYAMWQRTWLQGEALEAEVSYWKNQLAGAPPVLELPTDRTRPAVQTYRGARQSFKIPSDVTEELKSLSRREGTTLFMTLLAAFQMLLMRYSGQTDIVVGTPTANRNRAETEGLIGFFINTLVMRTDLSGEPSFRETLRRVREVSLEAYAHENLPFEKIVEELNPERDLSHTPLVQVLFGFQNLQEKGAGLSDLSVSFLGSESGTARFDVVQNIFETEQGLVGTLHCNSDLFAAETMSRMVEHFQNLLKSICENPETPVSQLRMLGTAERQRIIVEWNETRTDYPERFCLHQLFEQQAARTPEAVVASYQGRSLSYGQINQRANRLAHLLVAQGVGQEVLVALLADRGFDLLTAILAVFKAGGAYLPLDQHAPASRLRQIIAQSSTPVMLVAADYLPIVEQVLENSPAEQRPQVLQLEELLARPDADEQGAQASTAEENLPPRSSPDSLAYVIYTSGSTGIPKGAMVEQRGMVNHLYAKVSDLALTETDKVAQTASQCFDISVWQMLSALVVGGQVEIFPDHVAHDARQLLNAVEQSGVTILETVPALLRAMLDNAALANAQSTTTEASWTNAEAAASGRQLRALRWMIPTGEALPPDLCRRWLAAYGHVPLMNAYGPTECSDDVSHHPIHEAPSREEMNVPIGRPVANIRLYVVDKYLRAVPVGVRGELCVGGVGVGRGYLGEPSRTAETFVPDPFSGESGKRLYRTGDSACWRADGSIEFLGRIDHQVKVRGFRIEPGEIEAALTNLDDIEDAVVMVHEDGVGAKHLVAYLVGASATADELRNSLKERLPDYMIPSTFIRIAAMPLTSNGKIDRRALPAPDMGRPEMEQSFVAPRTHVEKWLAQKWAEVLEIELEQIGVEYNFFSLGGDSIKAAIIVNRVQDALGEVVHVVTILDAPTVAGFARYLEGRYAHAIARMLGETGAVVEPHGEAAVESLVTEDAIEQLRRVSAEARARVAPLSAGRARGRSTVNLKPVLFILSPPRSGSTLLRVLLGGHPRLFAPPELELLGFETMRQRRDALSGRDRFWLEGVVRAVMQLQGCAVEEAQQLVAEYEQRGASTSEFYDVMQEWLGAGRMLVDKTPSYALEAEVLQRAEEEFGTQARYIHLVRRPEAMIHSFVEAQLDQIFPRFAHPFDGREVAELIWVISQQNILGFLKEVEPGRQHRVVFEELVSNPRQVLEGLCEFLDVEFDEQMLEPYAEREKRMTDGIRAESKMLGDVKFHQYGRVEAGVSERWRKQSGTLRTGAITRHLAEELGYTSKETGIRAGESARRLDGGSNGRSAIHRPLLPIRPAEMKTEGEHAIPDVSLLSDAEVEEMLSSVLSSDKVN
jgi:amino acid adenylation domain-containing protein